MPLSFVFRQSLARPTRRARRVQVVLFYGWATAMLLSAGTTWTWHGIHSWMFVTLLLVSALQDNNRNRKQRGVLVSSLDERTYLRYGCLFDDLDEARQREMLASYRVGTYRMTPEPARNWEQRQWQGKAKARKDAHTVLLWSAVPLLAVYLCGWFLLPAGRLRSGWTDWPTIVLLAGTLVFALPQQLWAWREPDVPLTERFHLPNWPKLV